MKLSKDAAMMIGAMVIENPLQIMLLKDRLETIGRNIADYSINGEITNSKNYLAASVALTGSMPFQKVYAVQAVLIKNDITELY